MWSCKCNFLKSEKEIWKKTHQNWVLNFYFLPYTLLSKCFVLNILPFKTKKWKVLFFKILLFRPSHSHLLLFPNKQTFNDINRLTAQKVRPWEAQQRTDKCQYEEANTKTLKFFLKRGSNRCAGTKIRKAERTVLDQLGWTQKGDAIPNLRVTLREGKRKVQN